MLIIGDIKLCIFERDSSGNSEKKEYEVSQMGQKHCQCVRLKENLTAIHTVNRALALQQLVGLNYHA